MLIDNHTLRPEQIMTSRERFIAASLRRKPDKVSVAPYHGNFGAALMGTPISIYNTNADRMAEAHMRTWEILHSDFVVAQSDNYYIAQGFDTLLINLSTRLRTS